MIKKDYMKPAMRVVKMQHKCHILSESAGMDSYGMNKKLQTTEEVTDGF